MIDFLNQMQQAGVIPVGFQPYVDYFNNVLAFVTR